MKEYQIPKNRFKNFYHFNSLESTMTESDNFIKKGIRSGIVLADMQTGGYGRNSKLWLSENNGNIYLSFFEKIPTASPVRRIPHRTALSVLYAVRKFVTDGSVRLKWPNDVLIDMKKVAGIIAKTVQFRNARYFICGIGVNVYLPECGEFSHTWEIGSVFDKNPDVTTRIFLPELITEIDKCFSLEESAIEKEFTTEISWITGKKIKFTQDNIEFSRGEVTGFTSDGISIKVLADNEEKEFSTLSISEIVE